MNVFLCDVPFRFISINDVKEKKLTSTASVVRVGSAYFLQNLRKSRSKSFRLTWIGYMVEMV